MSDTNIEMLAEPVGLRVQRQTFLKITLDRELQHRQLPTLRAHDDRFAHLHLPVKLCQTLYRPTEVSLQFIRWLRVGLTRPTCYRQAIAHLRPLMLARL